MKHIFTLLLLIVVTSTFAQVKFEGNVKNKDNEPLEFANVIAINKASKVLESYAVTNDAGRYKLNLGKNTTYTIQVSYIGYTTKEIEITTTEQTINKDFSLVIDNTLDEVELVYEMPVTISGDTIVYNADSFKSGTERKLEDVLKKLPGVEINADGQIEVEGKQVSKLMVEGKDFFDGDSKLATKNIPADAVDKVQVLKNFSNVGQLSGVQNNQDNVAINIKLKEGKKNFWFGTVTAGSGTSKKQELYIAQPKLFYYSPKKSINFIGDLNNIGELAFSRRDFFNFSGGFNMPSQQSGTNINIGNGGLNFSRLQNNKAKDINTKFGAANFSMSPNKALDIGGFGIFTSSRILLQENKNTNYTNRDLTETTITNTKQSNDAGLFKFKTKYKPNGNNQLDYDILAKLTKEEQNQNLFSSEIGTINQIENSKPFSLNQSLNYYYTLDENNIFAFEGYHKIADEDPFYNAILEDKNSYNATNAPATLGLDGTQTNYNIGQNKRVKSNQLDAKLDYWNVLTPKSNINFTLGTILSKQNFDSNIFQFLDNGSTFNPTAIINNAENTNATKYTFSDIYLGAHYRFKTGIFTITPGVSAHAYSQKNNQFNTETKTNFFRLLPDFNMVIQLKKSENIQFNYRMQTTFTDVTNLARGLVLNNYSSLYSGNPNLESALAHNFSLNYFSFNMFNYTNVFGRLSYTKNIDNIRSVIIPLQGVANISSSINSGFADDSFNAFGRFQRTFGKLKASIRGNFNFSKFNQLNNGVTSTNKNLTHSYNLGLSSNYKTAPNFDFRYGYTINDNDQNGRKIKYFTHAPSVSFDALLLKAFTFKTDYTYTNFRDRKTSINTYQFWNASLAYRKNEDSKFEYELKATNLLDTKSQNNTNTSILSVSETEYFIQPRFLTFRVIYSL